MCTPGLLLGAQSVSAAYGTVGSYFAAQEQKSALNSQAALEDINARLADRNVKQALRSGQLREQQSRLQNAALKSSQKVSLAANGVDLGSDSAVALLTTTDVYGEIDANEIARSALQEAWGYRNQAVNARNTADIARGRARGTNALLTAGTTLLTGATDVASSYYQLDRLGYLDEGEQK